MQADLTYFKEFYTREIFDLSVWSRKISPRDWLSNFDGQEYYLAQKLVETFLFFSNDITESLLFSAFMDICNIFECENRQILWNNFLNTYNITCIEGENSNPSDSGYYCLRKMRQLFNIDEDRILYTETAKKYLRENPNNPLVFVDDFIGTGNQFIKTYSNQTPETSFLSIVKKARIRSGINANIYLCCALATTYAIEKITSLYPEVKIICGSVIPDSYNIVKSGNLFWEKELHLDLIDFIKRKSFELGYEDCDGDINDWRGFGKLGLGVAFEHSTPDATLPLFYHQKDGWLPLVEKK